MDIRDFKAGVYKKGFHYNYFVPEYINHSFVWSEDEINDLLEKASLKLGELNSFSKFVPDTDQFIITHVFKEAVVSSRIEGTKTNMTEALSEEKEISPERRDDWKEVNNYVRAMNMAINDLEKLPISSRLLQRVHGILLSSARGEHRAPGEFRRSQNWIGGATITDAIFIPPIHDELPALLSDLEKFLNNRELKVPHLIRAAIMHYQFETIHPFLDGNGRVGRLLITLYLVSAGILEKPLLYLSDYFESNKALYYDNLTLVREKNDLANWIKFFLNGVLQTAENSVTTLRKIMDLKSDIERNRILVTGHRSKPALELLHGLFKNPVIDVKGVQFVTGLSPKSANTLIQTFIKLNILREETGFRRNRLFVFHEYLQMF